MGNGAGIGGGDDGDGGTITIYGGDITANGPTDSNCGENGAGIGGGYCGAGGTITINGGTITAYSRDGAGIGGGDDGDGGNITINGGTITSTKVNQGQGARIGGGCDAAPGTITIGGGNITPIGGYGAGIGGGKENKSGVSIRGISAMLESDNTLRLYLGFKDVEPSGLTYMIDGQSAELKTRSDGASYLALDAGVYSNHLQDTNLYSISDGTLLLQPGRIRYVCKLRN